VRSVAETGFDVAVTQTVAVHGLGGVRKFLEVETARQCSCCDACLGVAPVTFSNWRARRHKPKKIAVEKIERLLKKYAPEYLRV
jgi:hypothetical protein